ncbi:cytosolic non-specific dipeptidase [Plakobranchus ocellatus]|uniref:Cytosolic non-specific dipeptidase n=1 Tax=Plakobranchus ocellatus TaxID=259542 RepID=A0AAV3YKF1_9GAST|nr:cytosolic non-specific dipeptidase [Plakobranchus ocellatus]
MLAENTAPSLPPPSLLQSGSGRKEKRRAVLDTARRNKAWDDDEEKNDDDDDDGDQNEDERLIFEMVRASRFEQSHVNKSVSRQRSPSHNRPWAAFDFSRKLAFNNGCSLRLSQRQSSEQIIVLLVVENNGRSLRIARLFWPKLAEAIDCITPSRDSSRSAAFTNWYWGQEGPHSIVLFLFLVSRLTCLLYCSIAKLPTHFAIPQPPPHVWIYEPSCKNE